LSTLLKFFTTHAVDLGGAFISPLLALLGGWFLWWWSRRMRFQYRWVMLILYAISPILVHGTELGRPDHQSLLILLLGIGVCTEWSLRREPSTQWTAISGIAWGVAIWVSAYEPIILLLFILLLGAVQDRHLVFGRQRCTGWILLAGIVALAMLIERRIPSFSTFYSGGVFKNWSHTIGELAHVSPANPIWLRWAGYLILVAPFLIWFGLWQRKSKSTSKSETAPLFIVVLVVVTYLLTIWQARWAYFFLLIFAIALPALLEPIKSRAAVSIAFVLSIFPILRDWDARLWPNEAEFARRVEQRNESMQLRELVINMRSSQTRPFLAPWWFSPAIAYWSGQPGVAGSSHESLPGIEQSARFFLSQDWQTARKILEDRRVVWVVAYDFERVARNSSAILGLTLPQYPLCFALERTPAQVPRFLVFSAQNGAGKLYRAVK